MTLDTQYSRVHNVLILREISRRRLVDFWTHYPQAQGPLTFWYKVTKAARWRSLGDTRRTFRHADVVKVGSGRAAVVFNIGGNKYRLITAVHYDRSAVYVLRMLTHKEYSRGKWKEEL